MTKNASFERAFTHNWPSILQYIRSTMHPEQVHPEWEDEIKAILYGYAKQTGTLPNIENGVKAYKRLLQIHTDAEVEGLFRTKAKRQAAKKKRQAKRAARKTKKTVRKTARKTTRAAKKTVRKTKRKAARAARGGKTRVGAFLQRASLAGKLVILAPFKKGMVKALAGEGYTISSKAKLKEIVVKFMKFVVKKERPDLYPANAVRDLEGLPDNADTFAVGPIIQAIVGAVKSFIGAVKDKSDSGEPLTKS